MKKIYVAFLLLVISTSVIANEEGASSKGIKPIVMAVVKAGSVQYEDICSSIKEKCNGSGDYSIWKSKSEENTFYFINRSPELVKIKK